MIKVEFAFYMSDYNTPAHLSHTECSDILSLPFAIRAFLNFDSELGFPSQLHTTFSIFEINY